MPEEGSLSELLKILENASREHAGSVSLGSHSAVSEHFVLEGISSPVFRRHLSTMADMFIIVCGLFTGRLLHCWSWDRRKPPQYSGSV